MTKCGYSTMVVHLVANQVTGVRFPLPAHPPFGRDERGSPRPEGGAARSRVNLDFFLVILGDRPCPALPRLAGQVGVK